MMDNLGGRKFVGFIVICVLLFALVVLNKLAVDTFVSFLTANFGLYVAGNSLEKFANKE